MKVPDQCSRVLSKKSHMLKSAVVWMSWPQACMVPTVCPSAVLATLWEAYGAPVCSVTGRPSKSARCITVGPSPFSKMAQMPNLPIGAMTSQSKRDSSIIRRL